MQGQRKVMHGRCKAMHGNVRQNLQAPLRVGGRGHDLHGPWLLYPRARCDAISAPFVFSSSTIPSFPICTVPCSTLELLYMGARPKRVLKPSLKARDAEPPKNDDEFAETPSPPVAKRPRGRPRKVVPPIKTVRFSVSGRSSLLMILQDHESPAGETEQPVSKEGRKVTLTSVLLGMISL